jgi:hypothetical protein
MAKKKGMLEQMVRASEDLIEQGNFSVENLCHAVDCGLKEVAEIAGTLDDLVAHVNDRFLVKYIERAEAIDKSTKDDLEALHLLNTAWLDHALANPRRMDFLLQHRWAEGYERPKWYVNRIDSCFAPSQRRLAKLSPKSAVEIRAAIGRIFYAHASGLYYLIINERAKPAGIASMRKLIDLQVDLMIKGLQAK